MADVTKTTGSTDSSVTIEAKAEKPKKESSKSTKDNSRETTSKPPRKRRSASLDRIKSRSGWLFVLPFVLGLVLIYFPLISNSVRFSFSTLERRAGQIVVSNVGFDNYLEVMAATGDGGDNFGAVLLEGVAQLAFSVPPIIVFSLFIAVLLNQKMMGRAAFRAIYFIPVIIATGLMDTLAQSNSMVEMAAGGAAGGMAGGEAILNEGAPAVVSSGMIWQLFGYMAIGGEFVEYVVAIIEAIFSIINRSGVQILIFLAGLQSIPGEVYESCRMDGATSWETFWKITFPMISPMILVNVVYSIIDSFTAADNIVMNTIATTFGGVGGPRLTQATAMGWLYFVVMSAVVVVTMGLLSLFVFYQRKD